MTQEEYDKDNASGAYISPAVWEMLGEVERLKQRLGATERELSSLIGIVGKLEGLINQESKHLMNRLTTQTSVQSIPTHSNGYVEPAEQVPVGTVEVSGAGARIKADNGWDFRLLKDVPQWFLERNMEVPEAYQANGDL